MPNPKPDPPVVIPAVAPDARRVLIAAAVRRYEDARAISERLEEPVVVDEDPDDDRPERCAWLACRLHDDAEVALIWAILTGDDGLERHDFARPDTGKLPRPPRGVVHGGQLYLAVPRPGRVGDPHDLGDPTLRRMRLVAVDLADVEVLAPA